jgi:hypothetical protein
MLPRGPEIALQALESLKPIGYTWSYLACRVGYLVPIWQWLCGRPWERSLLAAQRSASRRRAAADRLWLDAVILSDMQNRKLGPYLAAVHSITKPVGNTVFP